MFFVNAFEHGYGDDESNTAEAARYVLIIHSSNHISSRQTQQPAKGNAHVTQCVSSSSAELHVMFGIKIFLLQKLILMISI